MTTRLGINRIVCTAVLCFALFGILVSSASAGTYHVYQCHGNYGNVNSGWVWANNFNSAAGNPTPVEGCGPFFKLQVTGSNSGNHSHWKSPALPGSLGVKRVDFSFAGDNGGGATNGQAMLCNANAYTAGLYGQCGGQANVNLPQLSGWNGGWVGECATLANPTTRCKAFQFSMGTVSAYFGAFILRDLDFTIDDPVGAYAWQPHNGTLRNNNSVNTLWADGNYWNSGTKTVQVAAIDNDGGGVKNTKIFFDGASGAGSPDHNFNQSCDYVNWQPCATFATNMPGVDTTAFADGPHTATTRATDAGDNITDATVSFKVDNTKPDTPTAVDIVGTSQGWSSSNDFDVTWINATEEAETLTQSGVAHVKVNVEPTDPGSQVDPAAVTIPVGSTVSGIAATVNSISGLSLPAVGEWTLRLSVIDRAGNESPVGDGSGGSTDSDFTIGYDPTPPAAPSGYANGWISRDELANGYMQEWSLTRGPNEVAPICGFASSITDVPAQPGTTINVVGDVRETELPASLAEGNHWVNLRSVTCAGLASTGTEHVEAKVDRTDPTGQVSGVEDGQWYKDNQVVNLAGLDALSGMAGELDENLPAERGAYLAYSVNGTAETKIRGGNGSFTASGEGLKELSFSPVDLAGNRGTAKIVRFGIDATAPNGAFAAQDADRPTLLRAPVIDPTSGLNLASIEVRNQAGGEWITLPTSIADSSGQAVAGYPKRADVSARFPDTELPRGTYSVRLKSYDRAGNELVTSKRADGSEMTVTNPMRSGVALSAGLSKAVRTCKKKRSTKGMRGKKVQRNGKCFKRSRGKVIFTGTTQTLAVGFKRGAVVQGFLTDASYNGLSRQPIEVYAKTKAGAEQLIGTTSTRADGAYVFKIKPGMSRTIRVYFPGTETREDASTSVNLGTGAKITLKASTRNARTGTTVTFRGKVRSFDGSIPAAGKIVALQFYAGKKWRPAVGIVHTDSRGNYSVKYRFEGKGIKSRIVFRAFAPAEDNWSHTASGSKRITMKVNY